MNDFLNPRSMITPGVSGGLIMIISNTLWMQCSVPKVISSIVLSFLLVILIISKFPAPVWEKIIYFIFNGLLIFSFAINVNFVGGKISETTSNENNNGSKQHPTGSYHDLPNEYPTRPPSEGASTTDQLQKTPQNIGSLTILKRASGEIGLTHVSSYKNTENSDKLAPKLQPISVYCLSGSLSKNPALAFNKSAPEAHTPNITKKTFFDPYW